MSFQSRGAQLMQATMAEVRQRNPDAPVFTEQRPADGKPKRTPLQITTQRVGDAIRVRCYFDESVAIQSKTFTWKASAFGAGNDEVLIANRAASRMAERMGFKALWVGAPEFGGFSFRPAGADCRLTFCV